MTPDFSRDERKLRARVCDCDRESNGTYFPELIHRNRAAIDSANIPLLSPPFPVRAMFRTYEAFVAISTQQNSKWSLMTYRADGNDPPWGIVRTSNFAH